MASPLQSASGPHSALLPPEAAATARRLRLGQRPGRATPRVLYVLTAPFGLDKTLGGQLRYLQSAGFEPFIACSPGETLERFAASEGVRAEPIPIEREIAPCKDLRGLWRLWRLTRRIAPDVTNVSAPKAGLLGGLAAWLAGVRYRVYTLRGLRLETATGARYLVLWAAEWLACRLAHRVVCVSRSLARRVLDLRLARPEQVIVPASGSSNGVDPEHFAPNETNGRRAAELRRQLAIPSGVPVAGFVGRLTRDKGIAELVAAYHLLREENPALRLLLVGCFEAGDPVPASVCAAIQNDPCILVTGFVDDPAPYYRLMDVVALPTYREGYPTVALEAAAAGRPFVTTSATGAAETVTDGETGLLVPPRDHRALAQAIQTLLDDPERAAAMAERARRRAIDEFSRDRVWKAFEGVYRDLLGQTPSSAAGWARDCGSPSAAGSPRPPIRPLPELSAARIAELDHPFTQGRAVGVAGPDSDAPLASRWALSRGKRIVDIAAACLGLVAGLPLLMLAAGWVALTMGRPVLFRQPRAGLDGKPFSVHKLRTMAAVTAGDSEAQRLTTGGGLLRRWSLDELPQLWNVLCGEMSLIGPRPLPLHYLPRYTRRQRGRHTVKPGITGWAQVRGRNSLSWNERFELDLWYVENASFWMDLRILARSVVMVLSGAGVSPAGMALMPEFLGDRRYSA